LDSAGEFGGKGDFKASGPANYDWWLKASAESNMADVAWLFWVNFERRYHRGMRFIFNVDDWPIVFYDDGGDNKDVMMLHYWSMGYEDC
jgi:hypothetical protein